MQAWLIEGTICVGFRNTLLLSSIEELTTNFVIPQNPRKSDCLGGFPLAFYDADASFVYYKPYPFYQFLTSCYCLTTDSDVWDPSIPIICMHILKFYGRWDSIVIVKSRNFIWIKHKTLKKMITAKIFLFNEKTTLDKTEP